MPDHVIEDSEIREDRYQIRLHNVAVTAVRWDEHCSGHCGNNNWRHYSIIVCMQAFSAKAPPYSRVQPSLS